MWPRNGYTWPSYGIGVVPRPVRRLLTPSAQEKRNAAVAELNRKLAARQCDVNEVNRVPDAAQRETIVERCAADPGPRQMPNVQRSRVCSAPLRAALRPGHVSTQREVPPPRDQTELRLSLMRKLTGFLGHSWKCPARACRRHRACASPALECADLPSQRRRSPAREDAALASLQRALAHQSAQMNGMVK